MEIWMTRLLLPSLLVFTWSNFASGFYAQPAVVTFTTSPESVVVPEGGRVRLRCAVANQNQYTATTLPHPQIQWLLNGTVSEGPLSGTVSVSSHPLSPTLEIAAASPSHEGWYQCKVTDGHVATHCGSGALPCVRTDALSDRVRVQVIGNTTSRATAIEAPVGSSTLLECGSRLVSAGIRISWNRNGEELQNGANEYLLSSGDLFVSSGSDELHNSTYDCLVYLGNTVVHYQSYWLTQTQGLSSSLSVHTASPVALVGQTVELTCSSTSSSTSNVSWVLRQRGDTPLTASATLRQHLQDQVLVLEGVSLEDAGVYCCQVGDDGSTEACGEIHVMAEAALPDPTQVFLNFRDNSSLHTLNLTCPPHLLSLPVTWFRNGIELANSSERNLMRTEGDAELLYGVYQCVIGLLDVQLRGLNGRAVFHTVARVMPYGISNPPGGLVKEEQPWAYSRAQIPTYISWTAPNYTGNVSTLSYRLSYYSESHVVDTLPWLAHLGEVFYVMHLTVHDSLHGSVSDRYSTGLLELDFSCQYQVFFPPIPTLSCEMSSVQLTLAHDDVADEAYMSLPILLTPRINYVEGGCLNVSDRIQVLYQSFPNVSYGNQISFGGGMAFEVGTWCVIRAANTVHQDFQERGNGRCYDPQLIRYSDPVNCSVTASVGFTTPAYLVDEGEGYVEVCVQSEGYGFSINLTVSSITASGPGSDYADFDQYQLSFTSPVVSNWVCTNISITDDEILEPPEELQLLLSSSSEYVQIQRAVSSVTIIDNDHVTMHFVNGSTLSPVSMYTVLEDEGSLPVCVMLVGASRKLVTMTITTRNGSANAGVDFAGGPEDLVFEPFSTSVTVCYNISLIDNGLPENSIAKTFTLHLSNVASGVVVPDELTVYLVDDDGGPPTTATPQRTDAPRVIAPAVGVLMAVFLVVLIVAVILVILLARKKRNRGKLFLSDQIHGQNVLYEINEDALVRSILDFTQQRHVDFDNTSFIHPLTPTLESGKEGETVSTTELAVVEPMKKGSSSSLLLAAPQKVQKLEHLNGDPNNSITTSGHFQKKGDQSDASGYLNLSDTHGSVMIQNHHRSSTLSDEELMLSNPSLRDSAQSPEPHILSVGSKGDEEEMGMTSQPPDPEFQATIHALNPVFEIDTETFLSRSEGSQCTGEAPPPVAASGSHQEKDSGFPMSDSGCPLSDGDGSSDDRSRSGSVSDSAHSLQTAGDSGFPEADDSSSPLLPAKHIVQHASEAGNSVNDSDGQVAA